MRHTIIAVLLLAALARPAAAGPFEDAVSAHERSDYATALRAFRVLAEQGLAGAQFSLGVMYENGQGVPQNFAAAVPWYRKAADQGHAAGQYNLGFMYSRGDGVRLDYAMAVKWYRMAAEQGDASAQYNLGVM